MIFPFEKITHYGRPSEDYIRMTDRFHLDGDQLIIDRRIIMRGSIDCITIDVSVDDKTTAKESA